MAQKVRIKIIKLQYGGDSIGNDIRLEIETSGQPFSLDQTIEPKTTSELNQEIAQLLIDGDILEIQIHIRVIEKDLLFNDVGEISGVIQVDPLKTEHQTFDFQIKVQEKNKVIGKSTAVFSITFGIEIFNPDNIQLKPYNSNNIKKDYNRFDENIKSAVKFWNDEFLSQEYPPSVPLDPDLVKAIVYIESEMGYYKKGTFPPYPNIMQVGNSGDPSLHTLNNDGWISPRTGKVAREYEWKSGGEEVLDYHGKANAKTHQESLKWGIRWLYHKAQEIKDGKRVWHNWKEAVKGYGPGKRGYEEKIWNIYTKGTTPAKTKLWSVALFLPILPALIFGGWLALNQGRIYISFKDMPDTSDGYQVMAKVVDGLWFENLLLTNTYLNGQNSFGLDKNIPINKRYIDIESDGQKEIEVIGYYLGGTVKYLLKKENGQYRIVHLIDEWGTDKKAFSGEQISFLDINNNGKLDVVTDSFLDYENAPDQVWSSYYHFDGKYYKFYKKDIVNFSDFKRLLVTAPDYYARK